MNLRPREQRDWLDQAIEQTRPGQPRPDYKAWSERHSQTLASLQQRASQKVAAQTASSVLLRLGRRIMQSPLTKIAAAIIAIVALLALARHLTAQDAPVTPPQRDIVKETTPTTTPQPDKPDPTQQELQLAQKLYQNNDQQGLLSLLETGQPETQIVIADYLAEIGDPDAIPALQKLADIWQGQGENPYQHAIEQIELKVYQDVESFTEPLEVRTPLDNDSNDSPVNLETFPVVTYQGYVTDKAGEPISQVRVWVGSQCRDEEFRGLRGDSYTDAQGHFVLTVAAEPDPPEEIRTIFFDHSDYGIGWFQWYPLARAKEGVIFNLPDAFKMELYPSASVLGRVVDTMGQPIQGAEIKANLQCLAYMGNYGYLLLDQALEEPTLTDSKGQFILGQIPEPARMHLFVSCIGYGKYSSRDESRTGVYPIRAGEKDLVIELEPATGLISGQLKQSSDGAAFSTANAIVIARSDKDYALGDVDAQGCFALKHLVDGDYWVQAFDSKRSKIPICRPMQIFISENNKSEEVVLSILELNPFTVTVVDELTGEPLSDVAVYAECVEGGDLPRAFVDSDTKGQCVLQLVPGEYLICANGWRGDGAHQFSQKVSVEAYVEGARDNR